MKNKVLLIKIIIGTLMFILALGFISMAFKYYIDTSEIPYLFIVPIGLAITAGILITTNKIEL